MVNSNLRIAFVGNMNNNFFCLMRLLRDRGISSDLLLFKNEFEHFLPEADSFDENDYVLSSVKRLTWSYGATDFFNTSKKEISSVISNYDFIIGLGPAPAYLSKANRDLDLFIPYGGDLLQIAICEEINFSPRRQKNHKELLPRSPSTKGNSKFKGSSS